MDLSTDAPSRTSGHAMLALAAFLMPAAPPALFALFTFGDDQGVPANAIVSLVLSAAWIVLVLTHPRVRTWAMDLGTWLIDRTKLGVLLCATLVAFLFATAPGNTQGAWMATFFFVPLLSARIAMTRQREPARLTKVAILIALQLVLLIAVDVVAGLYLPNKSHNSIFLDHDPYLGWKLRAGLSVERVNDRYTSHETINERGFRTALVPYEKPAGTKRILILGDSHSEGYTVNDDQTYAVKLQQHLRGRIPSVQVISLGVGGFSTDQELLAYLHYGRRYDPDVVILQFCPNDVAFNGLDRYWRGLKPRFERFGEVLVLDGVPVPDQRKIGLVHHPLFANSNLALLIESSLGRLTIQRDAESVDEEECWKVTDLLIRDLHQIVTSDGATMFVFNSNPDDAQPNARIRQLVEARGIPFVDIEPAFGGDITAHRVPDDHHWNAAGHQDVAMLLGRVILERGWL
ncbi:MAG: SGNH/GDSL hydrolase family protein [Planctomycetes bacterium]|nr:SGNH/GDSL hydrolase family protein [Planctomycetota bacterium]